MEIFFWNYNFSRKKKHLYLLQKVSFLSNTLVPFMNKKSLWHSQVSSYLLYLFTKVTSSKRCHLFLFFVLKSRENVVYRKSLI